MALGCAFALGGLAHSANAGACGPCNVPEVVNASYGGEELFVQTNFGVLRKTKNGWHLECEELMGGTITGAQFGEQSVLIATSSGFFRDGGELCSWKRSTAGASNDWFLDFATFDAGADAGQQPGVVALTIDRDTSETKLEMAELGGRFSTLATFGAQSGLRRLTTGGDPVRLFATGYTYSPTTWHVLSGELGATDFVDRAFAQDGATAELRLLAVDPDASERLWIRAAELGREPDALLLLDPGDEAPRVAFRLGADERLADVAFSDDLVLVAARGDGVSRIHAADRDDLEFRELAEVPGTLTCLEVTNAGWLACNSAFTRDSEWLVATSDDEGASWTPQLTLDDLGAVSSCGESCGLTTAWLTGLFGSEVGMPSSSGGRDFEDPPELSSDAGARDGDRKREKKSGCAVGGASSAGGSPGWLLLLGIFLRRSRAARQRQRAR